MLIEQLLRQITDSGLAFNPDLALNLDLTLTLSTDPALALNPGFCLNPDLLSGDCFMDSQH